MRWTKALIDRGASHERLEAAQAQRHNKVRTYPRLYSTSRQGQTRLRYGFGHMLLQLTPAGGSESGLLDALRYATRTYSPRSPTWRPLHIRSCHHRSCFPTCWRGSRSSPRYLTAIPRYFTAAPRRHRIARPACCRSIILLQQGYTRPSL